MLLQIKNINKKYFKKSSLIDINMNIQEGKIVGLLGPNGSGKTTLMKIIASLIRANKGEILINGYKPGIDTKKIVSYLPDKEFLPNWMKIKDAIKYYEDFFPDFSRSKCIDLIKFMKLDENMHTKSLSKGMMEKLNLSLVLSREARLYLLDEPLGGIDLVDRENIMNMIINNYNEKSSILISTHLINDIESLFDEVFFIDRGTIILHQNAENIREKNNKSISELYREVFKNA
ncbi:ABC transporter ATP-binding protein [Clostridium sediminicola]|uniref:ABC transporter ATP-binding protein n=1 Tax=Clostridium sediminicola TaxID=3114879 RepID=UPI0031F1C51F